MTAPSLHSEGWLRTVFDLVQRARRQCVGSIQRRTTTFDLASSTF